MSKDTPEVGDVWYTKSKKAGNKRIIISGIKNSVVYVLSENGVASTRWCYVFKNGNYTYLGKSKANIDDLFKTENEE